MPHEVYDAVIEDAHKHNIKVHAHAMTLRDQKDIIETGTARAAEVLGLKDVGTLTTGKQADFIVLDANPLDDILNTRKISAVYLRGAKLDRQALLAGWKGTN